MRFAGGRAQRPSKSKDDQALPIPQPNLRQQRDESNVARRRALGTHSQLDDDRSHIVRASNWSTVFAEVREVQETDTVDDRLSATAGIATQHAITAEHPRDGFRSAADDAVVVEIHVQDEPFRLENGERGDTGARRTEAGLTNLTRHAGERDARALLALHAGRSDDERALPRAEERRGRGQDEAEHSERGEQFGKRHTASVDSEQRSVNVRDLRRGGQDFVGGRKTDENRTLVGGGTGSSDFARGLGSGFAGGCTSGAEGLGAGTEAGASRWTGVSRWTDVSR